MNILEILNTIKKTALLLSLVHSSYIGDIYDILNNNTNIKYGCVTSDITAVTRNENTADYTVFIYYADRTLQDNSNVKQIQVDAVNVLESIINEVGELLYGEINEYNILLFSQKFDDYCAGAWVEFTLSLESEIGICSMEEYDDEEILSLTITKNGEYLIDEPTNVTVDVVDEEAQQMIEQLLDEIEDLLGTIASKDIEIINLEETVSLKEEIINELNNEIASTREINITENGTILVEGLGYNKINVDIAAIKNTIELTQEEYDELEEYDKETLYLATKDGVIVSVYLGENLLWEKKTIILINDEIATQYLDVYYGKYTADSSYKFTLKIPVNFESAVSGKIYEPNNYSLYASSASQDITLGDITKTFSKLMYISGIDGIERIGYDDWGVVYVWKDDDENFTSVNYGYEGKTYNMQAGNATITIGHYDRSIVLDYNMASIGEIKNTNYYFLKTNIADILGASLYAEVKL